MFRRYLPLVALVCVGLLSWSAVGVAPVYAQIAYQGDPMSLSENQSLVQALLQDIDTQPTIPGGWTNPATGSAFTAADELGGLTSAEMAAGTLPSLASLGTVALAGATLYTSYKLFSPLGNVIARSIFGDPNVNSAAWTGVTPGWQSICNSGCKSTGGSTSGWCGGVNCVQQSPCTTCNTATFTGNTVQANGTVISGVDDAWVMNCGGPSGSACLGCTAAGLAHAGGIFTTICSGFAAGQQNMMVEMLAHLTAGSYTVITNTGVGTCGSAAAAGDCFQIVRTDKQLQNNITSIKDGATGGSAPYGSATSQVNKTGYTIPSTISGTAMWNAEDKCGGHLGSGTGTAAQEACRAAVNHAVDPSWTPGSGSSGAGATVTIPGSGTVTTTFTPFVLPQPDINETYTQYIDRLRGKGYTGTVTVTTAGSVTTGLGGKAVIDVTPSGGSTSTTLAWPTNPPSITTPAVAVAIDANPAGAPVAVAAPISGSGCSCPSLDFTPLSTISYGTKFPFGFFTWASGVFPASASAAPIAFALPYPGGGGSLSVTLANTDWETTYRPIVFPILEFLIVAASVWFFAAKVLGFGSTGGDE